ncbi:MAG: hypothetical protein ACD_57C00379G0003 [uncultured bacterium]|uniref:Response regulatory domain-containing protein n=1 Tax=Candidatus Curtissbacteria bacterium RIFOXYA1_FULL_41_14 TaxID=1797737 RepID=A0A1F5HGD8_9BACT|nr:MAG: hypothetical protein ACD_57C00379G0003 [uncultured bacterium]KKR56960.1 MAG: response regulator receiver [Candidatus Curtissbacteria bacterium GW2011_GWB1_40_28]KKR61102.1 MAG: response regulator receiver [Candidatus Curtissbacteria bacterium GW2011_GWA2_40_31]KKR61983.1 MAG: response regulator receiver [Microgenomates group bacterium GW2011_GWC1_40_35]KKR66083.1 MAG: response regulator receiver [Candidatus Curtissbacteria bacterium GW2011_GWA1_40_47]KKR77135.1 MAG: response regulator 
MRNKKKKIWIIDDDLAILQCMAITLEDEGYQVLTFENATVFEKAIERNLPDIILMDYYLPDQNGDQLILNLEKKKKTKKIPVILISAHHEARNLAKKNGVVNFLAKPFDTDTLLNIVKKNI